MFSKIWSKHKQPVTSCYISVSNQDGRGDPLTIDDRIMLLSQEQIRKYKTD